MTNLSKLLISTGALCSTREDPRNEWEFFSMPDSKQAKIKNKSQNLKTFFRMILNAFRMP